MCVEEELAVCPQRAGFGDAEHQRVQQRVAVDRVAPPPHLGVELLVALDLFVDRAVQSCFG